MAILKKKKNKKQKKTTKQTKNHLTINCDARTCDSGLLQVPNTQP